MANVLLELINLYLGSMLITQINCKGDLFMNSIFTPLKAEGLTSFKIRYDWKTDKVRLFAAKEWDKDFDFSKYNTDFYTDGIYTDDAIYLNTKEVWGIFEKNNQTKHLQDIINLIKKGKHIGIECYFYEKYNIRFICNQHSFELGVNNKSHSIMAGGIRRHGFEDTELEVIIDGLNLGRAMSFKNVAADLSFGGCKTTVHMEPLDISNMEVMGFLAFALDRARNMTGPDMNFPTEMADVMTSKFSMQFTGGPNAPLGETGKPTAYGVYLALKQAVKFQNGTESLDGLTIAVQGLGAVGWHMAELLCQEKVKLIVTDMNKTVAEKFIREHKDCDISYVAPDEILNIEANIFCPCAIGGIIHEGNISGLKFDIIFGAANNQLRASSQEEEIQLAKMLSQRGILYQTEWWHNTAGVLCGAEEYYFGKNATYDNLIKKIEDIVPKKTWENLKRAKEKGITPCESVYELCQMAVYK